VRSVVPGSLPKRGHMLTSQHGGSPPGRRADILQHAIHTAQGALDRRTRAVVEAIGTDDVDRVLGTLQVQALQDDPGDARGERVAARILLQDSMAPLRGAQGTSAWTAEQQEAVARAEGLATRLSLIEQVENTVLSTIQVA